MFEVENRFTFCYVFNTLTSCLAQCWLFFSANLAALLSFHYFYTMANMLLHCCTKTGTTNTFLKNAQRDIDCSSKLHGRTVTSTVSIHAVNAWPLNPPSLHGRATRFFVTSDTFVHLIGLIAERADWEAERRVTLVRRLCTVLPYQVYLVSSKGDLVFLKVSLSFRGYFSWEMLKCNPDNQTTVHPLEMT